MEPKNDILHFSKDCGVESTLVLLLTNVCSQLSFFVFMVPFRPVHTRALRGSLSYF